MHNTEAVSIHPHTSSSKLLDIYWQNFVGGFMILHSASDSVTTEPEWKKRDVYLAFRLVEELLDHWK
jgi:hypothetical protein